MKYPNGNCKLNSAFMELRKSNRLTHEQLGKLIGGYHRETVFNVEHGYRYGTVDFWLGVQQYFNIPDEDMWRLIKGE